MNLFEKLFEIQKALTDITKDGKNTSDKYDYVSGEAVLKIVRPKMDELGLLLIPEVQGATLHEGATKSGTVRFLTEVYYKFTWYDIASGEKLEVPWYAQGSDLAGERGVGKAASYGEKIFLLKFFHIPTDKDDPDAAGRTQSGELRQRGTQAAKESADYYRKAISAMMTELSGGDEEKFRAGIVSMTKSTARGYAGVEEVSRITDAALPVVYAKLKKNYATRTGKDFAMEVDG